MTREELYDIRKGTFAKAVKYSRIHYKKFDYSILSSIMYVKKGFGENAKTFNDVIIMLDTETSKEKYKQQSENYVVAWTITIRAFDQNVVTLFGHRPSEACKCLRMIHQAMSAENTIFYVHNLAYDWVFLRKFLIAEFGRPVGQLNTKPHCPLYVEFPHIILKDSLILAQRSLEKWADDLNVQHKKAVGKWDYDKVRNQSDPFSLDELDYIECDTLAGVECIQATMDQLGKNIATMPYTATGIPREEVKKLAKKNGGRKLFLKQVPSYMQYLKLTDIFHGGYTHANRHFISKLQEAKITGHNIICYDFCSSYPFQMLSQKFPMTEFKPIRKPLKPEYILKNSAKYAFMFKLILVNPKLKSNDIQMPALQASKCTKLIQPILDNGRVLCAKYAEIYLNEIDLSVIAKQYDLTKNAAIVECEYAKKEYLPRWFTDYIFKCFADKCLLKGGDPVLYSIAKAKLNSLYGMCVQKCVKEIVVENYDTGEYKPDTSVNMVDAYDAYKEKKSSVLPFQWGCWVTSYAFARLFELGDCVGSNGIWLYSDTDSCYATNWDDTKIKAYNDRCIKELKANGYDGVTVGNETYYPGIAEYDGEYEEFVACGAKRYAVRYAHTPKNIKKNVAGTIKITVAGVPKTGAKCLNDDLNNFRPGMCFSGTVTGKKLHSYYFSDKIWIDANGNERGDSIDLSPTDYILDDVDLNDDWESLYYDEIAVQVYE